MFCSLQILENMRKYNTLLVILTLCSKSIFGQPSNNLITNGSFEELLHLGAINNLVKDWVNVSYFHHDKKFKQQVFQLYKEGQQAPSRIPKKGELLYKAELYARPTKEEFPKNHRTSYYQTILNETLQEGHHYELAFHIAKAEDIEILIPKLGIYLSEKPLTNTNVQKQIYDIVPQLVFHLDRPNTSEEWYEMKATFTAKGKEKYIAIGVFGKPDFKVELVRKSEDDTFKAFYYIDDISVKKVAQNVLLSHLDSGTVYALNSNILFDVSQFDIMPQATESLDALSNALRQNSKLKIEIAGHTDNTGEEKENMILSQKRAESVLKFLLSSGIDSTRLSAKGYGSQRPIAENSSPKGKEKNRRVEFIISK